MKKKLLVFMLLLVTVAVLAVPTPALAWGGWGSRTAPTGFTATAQIAVTAPGDVQVRPLGNQFLMLHTVGEEISGSIIDSSGWDLNGLNIFFSHQSNTFINLGTQKITGTSTGQIQVYDGTTLVMEGNYSAFIRGDVQVDPAQILYTTIYDSATFSLQGVDGTAFAGKSASGVGFAELDWSDTYGTLVGQMKLAGTYR